ncbi:winged helix-turn-helix domain-containing protein [Mycobacteroides abscessus]|uniref:winged helix-turn-helix domain-containing protein n=1 Tax=Mycobacteroides abscessus TaxID=36809 RepID=UPI0014041A2D|nr:winged helix-turn-helix domain-containing protein [Mycobacteroides abscessus]
MVVDDEPTICASISARLRAEGYAVDTEDNGPDAVRHCRENPPDLMWGWSEGLPSGRRTVDSHIKALRRKLGQELIRTVHGIGYALEAPR